MKEIRAVAVFVFRVDKGQHYFYLVKRGPKMPFFPSTWTPIASIISDKDIDLYEKLRKKHGDIVENMLDKVTVLRLLLQRNLIVDPEFIERNKRKGIMKKTIQSKTCRQRTQFTADLTQQKILHNDNTGFLFCPRCGSVVMNENHIGICSHCGHRFCPSCSD